MTTLKKQTTVRSETIGKGLNYFNDLSNHLEQNSGKLLTGDNLQIAKRNKVANHLIYYATNLGYIQKIERGVYKKIKNINAEDVQKIIDTYNRKRNHVSDSKPITNKVSKAHKTTKVSHVKEKTYKPKSFSSLLNQTEKYFVVDHRGLPLTKPMGIKRAKALAENYAKKNYGGSFYVAEVKFGVSMKYVTSTYNL